MPPLLVIHLHFRLQHARSVDTLDKISTVGVKQLLYSYASDIIHLYNTYLKEGN